MLILDVCGKLRSKLQLLMIFPSLGNYQDFDFIGSYCPCQCCSCLILLSKIMENINRCYWIAHLKYLISWGLFQYKYVYNGYYHNRKSVIYWNGAMESVCISFIVYHSHTNYGTDFHYLTSFYHLDRSLQSANDYQFNLSQMFDTK